MSVERQALPARRPDAPLELETARLRMRRPRMDDLDHFAAMWADIDVERYLTGVTHPREESAERLAQWIGHWETRGWAEWVVELRAYETTLGYCGLEDLDGTGEVEIGYGFAKEYWGRGYASEGGRASLAWGFQNLSVDRIVGVADHDNGASLRVLEKIGMRYEKDGTWYGKPMRYLAISRAHWGRASMLDRSPHSLYVHIPFCVSKCPYCDFNSHVGLEHLFESYKSALVAEIRAWGRELGGPRLDTIFIGGGTPSRVPSAHIQSVMDAVRDSFDLAPDAEVTLEANPQSAETASMEAWLRAGVNRLSLGFQSLDPDALAFLERAHGAKEATAVFRQARVAGFANISCDLIFGIPGLSTTRWAEVLSEVLALAPDHVSAYELTPELGTRLGADVASGQKMMPDEDTMLAQYEVAEARLAAAGFDRYEVSNWGRPGRECRHNTAYWSGVPYAAAGAGAHAFLHPPNLPAWLGGAPPPATSVRQWNLSNPAAYISAVRAQGHAVAGREWLDLPTTLFDLVMMGLRREVGVDLAAVSAWWGAPARVSLGAPIDRLRADGLLELAGSRVRPTRRGRRLLNTVVAEFLPAEPAEMAMAAGYNP